MKSNYKKLAPYIRLVDIRNTSDERCDLLGVSVDKHFIKSIANTIGTDWRTYKVIQKGQFCYIPDTSRRGDKMGIALLTDYDIALVSQAYTVFEIINQEQLLPEYLNLWFKRPEFDRYARFHSHGSVREIFDWEEMCNVELPIPEIEEQRKIVEAYKTIEKRIALKRKINDNLEAHIQSIFEESFPDCTLGGQTKLGDYAECVLGGTPSRDNQEYWNGDIAWINSGKVNDFRITTASESITKLGLSKSATKLMPKHTVVLAITGATLGQESILLIESSANQSVVGILENPTIPYEFIHPFIKKSMRELLRNQTGGAQPHINKDDVNNIPLSLPTPQELDKYTRKVRPLFNLIEKNMFELDKLTVLLTSLLMRLSR